MYHLDWRRLPLVCAICYCDLVGGMGGGFVLKREQRGGMGGERVGMERTGGIEGQRSGSRAWHSRERACMFWNRNPGGL